MEDAGKHLQQINGGTLVSDVSNLFSVVRTRRTMAFAYVFAFAFVAFTAFFAFNPSSNSSSPWFSNIFSLATPTPTSRSSSNSISSSTASGNASSSPPSQFSSIYSYFFPNTSSQQAPAFAPPSRSNDTLKQLLPPASSGNLTIPPPLFLPNHTANDVDKGSILNNSNQNNTVLQGPVVANHTKGEALKPNQTVTQLPHNPKPPSASGSNSPKNSTFTKTIEKGVKSNYTASLLKKNQAPNSTTLQNHQQKQGKQMEIEDKSVESLINCNFFDGNWVRDESYPLYKPGSCSFIDEQFSCILNGRPDSDYQKLRWMPNGCKLPRLDASHMLELLRGKRLAFVGDSLNRNMWESLVCILKNSVKDKSKVYEASGRHNFRTEASYSFIFKDYNCSVEFFVSPFLVREWEFDEKDGSHKETLRLDLIGQSSDLYKGADIIIFNTGHWWTHEKTSKGKDYYQEGSHVYNDLNVLEAFRKALTTWGRWIDRNVNPQKTSVFFRGYSASHFSGGHWNSGGQCDSETEPIKNETYLSPYSSKMVLLEKVLRGMKTQVTYLNITRITDYRKDGHPSIYRKQKLSGEEKIKPLKLQDCSHWCLPGVPDAWNELLYAELLIKDYQRKQVEKRLLR